MSFMYLDLDTVLTDLFNVFGIALVGGFTISTILHMMSFAVFGLIEFLDIKEK